MLHPISLASYRARFFSAVGRMACKKGIVNYKNKILVTIVSQILPNGEYGWQTIALTYQEQSNEAGQCNTDGLKRRGLKTFAMG